MQVYVLKESPAFVALSYEWGDSSATHEIIIDGAVFKIRQNLRDALEHLRILQADRSSTRLFDDDSPLFWIDAITIDQSNGDEKNHQVSMMGTIYRQASHVIAWLGLEQLGDDSALAMKYLSTGYEVFVHPKYHDLRRRWAAITSAEKLAIEKLYTRSYFKRIWIVQEVVLARNLHLVCGLQYCSWEQLHDYKFSSTFEYDDARKLFDTLFVIKTDFEADDGGGSSQGRLLGLLELTANRQCSQFHDRIYALLGVLQHWSQSTGMVVDYAVSCEELMIRTLEFLASDPEDDDLSEKAGWIGPTFRPDMPVEVIGKVAWYWEINKIIQKLDANVIKGFHKLETLGSEKERALIFQTICWIVGGYGVDLFSPFKDDSSLSTATTMPTITLESLKDNETPYLNNRTFIMHWRCTTGILTYCICLTHRPRAPETLLNDYLMTESHSWGCRSLLETYSKHVQYLGKMRESFKASTKVSDLVIQTQLPIQVEWMVFSNLLAQYFLSKFCTAGSSNRKTRTGRFVRKVEREGKDLGTFLTEALFSKYRMSVAETPDELPANALKSVEIEITSSDEADHSTDFGKKILVAALYDNDARVR